MEKKEDKKYALAVLTELYYDVEKEIKEESKQVERCQTNVLSASRQCGAIPAIKEGLPLLSHTAKKEALELILKKINKKLKDIGDALI